MKLVSFDPYRTLNLPGVRHVKPEQYLSALELIREADWVLFPEYWQLNTLMYGLRKRIFPSPASYHIGIDKIAQTRAFTAALPAHVPETLILGNTPENQKLAWDCMWLPFVAKLPRSSEGQGVFLIESEFDWQRYVRMTDVLYVQEYLRRRDSPYRHPGSRGGAGPHAGAHLRNRSRRLRHCHGGQSPVCDRDEPAVRQYRHRTGQPCAVRCHAARPQGV